MENLDASELLPLLKFPQLIFGSKIKSQMGGNRFVVSEHSGFPNRQMTFFSIAPEAWFFDFVGIEKF